MLDKVQPIAVTVFKRWAQPADWLSIQAFDYSKFQRRSSGDFYKATFGWLFFK